MRKLFCLLFAASSLLASAGAAAKTMLQSDGYKITGTAEGVVTGDTVYLCEMQGYFSLIPVDTTLITDGNKFEFTGEYNGAAIRFITPMHGGEMIAISDFILENAPISIQMFSDKEKKAVVNGGPAAKLYDEYNAGGADFDKGMEKYWPAANDSTASEESRNRAQAAIDSINDARTAYTKKFIDDHIPSAVSDMLMMYYMSIYTEEELEALLKKMGEGHHYVNYNYIMAERAASAATAVGKQYTDLEMPDPDGKNIRVSDYVSKNKYTLVDFWASWCGPCRAEMPNVVKAYNDYHTKGFEVVGVSFDNNKEAWVKAIGQLQMPWPQMSDLKGWGCAAAPIYNIKGIPANVLINQKGEIVAKDLRGEDLLKKLAELM